MQHANDWLKKQLDIENVAISIQPQQAPPSALADNVPVLRSKHLHFAALAPVFAVLANRAVVGQTTADIDVTLAPIVCTITNDQLAWLKVFAQSLPTVLAARGTSYGYMNTKRVMQILWGALHGVICISLPQHRLLTYGAISHTSLSASLIWLVVLQQNTQVLSTDKPCCDHR